MEGEALFGKTILKEIGISVDELIQTDSFMSPENAEIIYLSMFGLLLSEVSQYVSECFPNSEHYNYFIGSIVGAMQDQTGRFNFHFLPYGRSLDDEQVRLQDLEDGTAVLKRRSKSEAYLRYEEPEISYIDIVPEVEYLQIGSGHSLHIYLPQELFAEAFGSFSGSICALCEIMELGMNIYKASYPDPEIGSINRNTLRYFQGASMQAGEELVARVLVECADLYGMSLDEFLNAYLFSYCQTNPTVLALLDDFVDPGIFSRSRLDLNNNSHVGSSLN